LRKQDAGSLLASLEEYSQQHTANCLQSAVLPLLSVSPRDF